MKRTVITLLTLLCTYAYSLAYDYENGEWEYEEWDTPEKPEHPIKLTSTYIPDETLLNLLKPYDVNNNGFIDPEEKQNVLSIDAENLGINNATGINYLNWLTKLTRPK